jgi:5-formyltetrahydrofolate cyclo-ligase
MTQAEIHVLRKHALRQRREMDASYRSEASRRICKRFLRSRHFLSSRVIACYLSAWDEVDTSEIIERAWRANKRIFAPVMRERGQMTFCELHPDTRLVSNEYGLWEPRFADPVDPARIDIVVTPLVAFDRNLNRIGMGSGYFDRAFAFLGAKKRWLHPKLIGLGFDCQEVEKISPNPWDIRLYRVFSETLVDAGSSRSL